MSVLARTVAGYRGDEYDAAIYLGEDFQHVTLRSAMPVEGFEPAGEHFQKDVELSDCESLHYVRTVAQYGDLPVAVTDELGDQVEVESLAHNAPAAAAAGLERVERGVYRSWVAASALTQRRLEYLDLTPPAAEPSDGSG